MSTVTKPIALDETLQGTNTALGSLGKDTTLQAIATAIANVGLSNIGNMSSLATTDKTSLVSAINEVVGEVSDLDTDKADKVASATNGNLAGLNGSGNLTDSGWASDKTTTSASGNPISITGLKSNQLAVNPVITFEPIQAGSGDPSPSNVRAISGYDKIEVLSGYPNLQETYRGSRNANTGGKGEGTVRISTSNFFKIEKNKKYGIYVASTSSTVSGKQLDMVYNLWTNNSETTNSRIYDSSFLGKTYAIISYTSDTWLTVSARYTDNSSITTSEVDIIIVDKTTDLSEPLPQTMYGGSLDVKTGKFTVDMAIVDLGDMGWFYESAYQRFGSTSIESLIKLPRDVRVQTLLFSCYKCIDDGRPVAQVTSGQGYSSANGSIYIHDDRYTDANAFKTALTGQKLCYPLATPIEIQLTPHEISLLKDYAYVSTNGTSIALDYHNGEIATLGDVAQLGETVNELGDIVGKLIKIDTVDIAVGNNKITTSYKSADYVLISAIQINSNTSVAGTVRAYIDNGYWVIQTESVQVNTAKIRLLFTANI